VPELHKWEQEVASLGCRYCGAHSRAGHCFCISGLQDNCDLVAAAGLEGFKKCHGGNKPRFWQWRKIDPKRSPERKCKLHVKSAGTALERVFFLSLPKSTTMHS